MQNVILKDQNERLALCSERANSLDVQADGANYVACWIRGTLRGSNNPVVDFAVTLGNELALPVIVMHTIDLSQRYMTSRQLTFLLQASFSMQKDLEQRNIRCVRLITESTRKLNGVVKTLAKEAAALIVDRIPSTVAGSCVSEIADKANTAVIQVDGLRYIPEPALEGSANSPREFRALTKDLRPDWATQWHDVDVKVSKYTKPLGYLDDAAQVEFDIDSFVRCTAVDQEVPQVDWCSGSRKWAIERLNYFLDFILPMYPATRNNPAVDGISMLSPHIHFGVISPGEIAQRVEQADAPARSKWKFLDQLITWREFFYHCDAQNREMHRFQALPSDSYASLMLHKDDPRPAWEDLSNLINGTTADEVWNVAQRQFLTAGWMHNNLRMYWGKKIIELTEAPELAWTLACYLNDRLSLDGQDPATYGSIRWCFTAKNKQRDLPIYGKVPKKGTRALKARTGVTEWLAQQLQMNLKRPLDVPAALPLKYS